ncbi:MAG: signal peptide peptidase SppA [Pseudomonadota bacterium]
MTSSQDFPAAPSGPETPREPSMGPSKAGAPLSAPLLQGALDTTLEKLARDFLRDRQRERRWRVFFRLMWLGLFGLFVLASFTSRQSTGTPSGPHTALVEVRGEISSETEASAELLVGALKTAFEDNGAQAVVLRINSPGGSPVQSGIIYDEIKRLKALHKKKVYAVVEEVCASGAYYIASAADEIYTDKASIVGSIGVLMNGFGFTGLMDKLGVDRRLLTAGENKGMGDPFSPINDKQQAFTQAMLDQIHAQFIQVVKEGRGQRLKETPEMFSGLYWTGEQAVALGLADHLGNLDYVAREVIKAEEVVDYTPKENVAERLVKRFGASIGTGAVKALQSMGGFR